MTRKRWQAIGLAVVKPIEREPRHSLHQAHGHVVAEPRLALLKEAVPDAKLVGILMNPASPITAAQQLAPIRDAAALVDIALVVGEARGADTIPGAWCRAGVR